MKLGFCVAGEEQSAGASVLQDQVMLVQRR